MRKVLLLSACALFSIAAFAQNHPDTLSLANYEQKASAAVTNTFSTLSLSAAQQDSVSTIFKDYFHQLATIKTHPGSFRERSQSMQVVRMATDAHLKKILTPSQYHALVLKRQADYQQRLHLIDSTSQRPH